MRLSKNFTLKELIKSEKAKQLNFDNRPARNEQDKILYLTLFLLQPIRDMFGRVNVTSGYRCPELNQSIGGAAKSQHRYGEAVDFRTPEADLMGVFEWIKSNLTFGQVIYENPGEGIKPWIHLSLPRFSGENKQALFWDGEGDKSA
jgi:uncharacterized protein YcbK (DUF882 family)